MKNTLVTAAAVLALGYAASAHATANVSVDYGSVPSGFTDHGLLGFVGTGNEYSFTPGTSYSSYNSNGPQVVGTATGDPNFTFDFSFTAPNGGNVDATYSYVTGNNYSLVLYNGQNLIAVGSPGTDSVYESGTPDFAFGPTTIAAGTYDIVLTAVYNGGGIDGGDFQVNETPASTGGVPEPATWAMLLIGFAGIGVALRRRPSESSSAA